MRHFARENESIALGSARSASFSIAREQMPREQIPSLIAWPPFLDRSLDPFLLPLSLLPIHSIVGLLHSCGSRWAGEETAGTTNEAASDTLQG